MSLYLFIYISVFSNSAMGRPRAPGQPQRRGPLPRRHPLRPTRPRASIAPAKHPHKPIPTPSLASKEQHKPSLQHPSTQAPPWPHVRLLAGVRGSEGANEARPIKRGSSAKGKQQQPAPRCSLHAGGVHKQLVRGCPCPPRGQRLPWDPRRARGMSRGAGARGGDVRTSSAVLPELIETNNSTVLPLMKFF